MDILFLMKLIEKHSYLWTKWLMYFPTTFCAVCSTTLWVGQLDKRTQQQDVACLLEEFGQIESINVSEL